MHEKPSITSPYEPILQMLQPNKRSATEELGTELTGKISRSCDVCKSKKIKCDGLKPMCTYCLKHDTICNYSITKKPGLKAGYGKEFNERLEALEEFKHEFTNEVQELRSKISNLDSFKEELYEKINQINNIATGVADSGSVFTTSYSTVSAKSQLSTSSIPMLLNPVESNNISGDIYAEGLPSKTMTRSLVSLYFRHFQPNFPILLPQQTSDIIFSHNDSKEVPLIAYAVVLLGLNYISEYQISQEQINKYREFCKERILLRAFKVSKLEELQAMTLLSFDSWGNARDTESWSFLALIAAGAIHLGLQHENEEQLSFISPNSSPQSSSTVSEGRPRPKKSINVRQAKLLSKSKNWVEEESRRRLFCGIYMLDRIINMSSSFPLKLPDYQMHMLVPVKFQLYVERSNTLDSSPPTGIFPTRWLSHRCAEYDSSTNELYDNYGYSVEIVQLLGEVQTFLKVPIDIYKNNEVGNWIIKFKQLESEIYKWKDSLPQRYRNFLEGNFSEAINIGESLAVMLYNMTLIRINSSAAFPHTESNIFTKSESSRLICLKCVLNIIKLNKRLLSPSNEQNGGQEIYRNLGPLYAFGVWIVSRVIIVDTLYHPESDKSLKNDSDLKYLKNILKNIGKTWKMAHKYYQILNFLTTLDVVKVENMRRPSSILESSVGVSVSEYGDGEEREEYDDDENLKHRNASHIISDMRLNSYLVSLLLSKKMDEERQKSNSPKNAYTSMDSPFNVFYYNAEGGTDSNIIEKKFDLNVNSFGFEDFFNYLDFNDFSKN